VRDRHVSKACRHGDLTAQASASVALPSKEEQLKGRAFVRTTRATSAVVFALVAEVESRVSFERRLAPRPVRRKVFQRCNWRGNSRPHQRSEGASENT
jgi:hypothetical protein